jgi:hypothetical protein
MYENRQYAVFATSELNLIDFSQVLETSVDTVRKSVDDTRTFVKWDGIEPPTCIGLLTSLEGTYTHEEMLTMLADPAWSDYTTTMDGSNGGG